MGSHHFMAKLTEGGGPPPHLELERVVDFADKSPDGSTWIALKKSGSKLAIRNDSTAIIVGVGRAPDSGFKAIAARILEKNARPPTAVLEWYADHDAQWHFYRLGTPEWLPVTNLSGIPGCSSVGKLASEAFGGSCTFAYWTLPDLPTRGAIGTLSSEVPPLRSGAAATSPRNPGAVATASTATTPSRLDGATRTPPYPLHGVDFSGGVEHGGRNKKLWVASWDDEGIRLRSGGDPAQGFTRAGLAAEISRSRGLWVLDFPFGIPHAIAAALGLATHDAYLAWSHSDANPTKLRDDAKGSAARAGVKWSTRRRVDDTHGTTWFPLFEQLYRQTLAGARDVLRPLRIANVSILPFTPAVDPTAKPMVVEGFPGFTLRSALRLPATGYKNDRDAGREARAAIVETLTSAGLPIPDGCRRAAVADAEGDAVDALVLLFAALRASTRPVTDWAPRTDASKLEGWFHD
jgi:hypothetical protein